MNEELYELYKNNPEFKGYVDQWCKQKGCGIFEALRYKLIQEYAKIVKEGRK